MTFRRAEIRMLEQMRMTVTARPMPMPLEAMVETARVGQVPSTRRKVGFSVMTPLRNTAIFFGDWRFSRFSHSRITAYPP